MKTYAITLVGGVTITIAAARFVTDGSGTRLYDLEGGTVAAWADGQVRSIYPVADAVVTPPGCEALYSERIARLPGTVFCYAPEADYPYPDYGPAHQQRPRRRGRMTFWSWRSEIPSSGP